MISKQFILLLVLSATSYTACKNHENNNSGIAFPVSITFVEGDDGLDSNTLRIISNGNHFSAIETATDNFSVPKHIDTLRVDSLSLRQLGYLDTFLNAFNMLPRSCEGNTASMQALTVTQKDFKRTVNGQCNWGKASYDFLRQIIFGKSLY